MPEPAASTSLFRGAWVRVDREEWPGIDPREVVRVHDAAAVLPVTPSGDVLLVRQFRPAARRAVLEIPAGLLDVEGEEPAECAARELYEETGHRAASIDRLAGIFPSPGSWTEFVHIFVARAGAEPEGAPEDGIEVIRRPLSEMVAEARAGRIDDAKTALALLLADARTGPG